MPSKDVQTVAISKKLVKEIHKVVKYAQLRAFTEEAISEKLERERMKANQTLLAPDQ